MTISLEDWLMQYDNCQAFIEDLPRECLSCSVFNGETLLHVFAMRGDVDAVRELIARGADVTVRMEYGETPLHAAAAAGSLEVCQELVRAGGEELRKVKTREGYTARQYAEMYFLREKYSAVTGEEDYRRLLEFLS